MKHLTVRDNTDGRRQSFWARNRRSDDYELMCKDGRRTNIDDWENCHLGQIPASAMVTASKFRHFNSLIRSTQHFHYFIKRKKIKMFGLEILDFLLSS